MFQWNSALYQGTHTPIVSQSLFEKVQATFRRRYCQLKSNLADFLPRASNLNAEQSMSYEFVYCQNFGQIHLT